MDDWVEFRHDLEWVAADRTPAVYGERGGHDRYFPDTVVEGRLPS